MPLAIEGETSMTEGARDYVKVSFWIGALLLAGVAANLVAITKARADNLFASYAKHQARGSVSLAGVAPPLAAKARELVSVCGSKIISAVRKTRVRGSGRMSQHADGTAIDASGNPRCIYARLKKWPGGYTTDYRAVAHVHISYGGREHGLRFAHYRSKKQTRLARRQVGESVQ